jgi:uncharacterized protein YukE
MPESFAGITVPEGEPDTVRDAAQTFRGIAGGLHGVSGDLSTIPGLVGDWQGLAASAFHGTVPTNGSCIDGAAEAMSTCAEAARTYADELETAQKEAEAAIEEARDAQRRIDHAQSDLESALSAQITASDQIMSASMRLSSGVPDPSAAADLDAAGQAMSQAQTAESDARRRLEQAQDDLERAQRRGERAEKNAKDAARAAAGAFEGVAGGSPAAAVFGGSPTAIEGEILARVRAGDYSVLDTVPMNYLPEDTQRAIGAEMAKDADEAAADQGDHSMEEMAGIVSRYQHDEELATGFYNQLRGCGTADFVSNTVFFHGGDGLDDPELVALMAPFATLLGTATRSGGLQSGFTGGFLRTDLKARDRLGGHNQVKAFVMAGEASNYSSRFLSEVGEELLIMPLDPANEDIPGFVDIHEHQDFMKFMAGNPEAAGILLAGHHGPGGHYTNAGALMEYGRYTDEGEALGALINAGAHELRSDDMSLANDAAHAVIQATPHTMDLLGDKAEPVLVTVLDDHITEFEYLASERGSENVIDPPAERIGSMTYEEAFDYLKALVGDDVTRDGATASVGNQVADSIQIAIGQQDTSYANSAGALSEMGVLATAEANLDTAEQEKALNGFAKTATGKLAGFTPVGKNPIGEIVINQALDDIFSTDQVEKALEEQSVSQLQAHEAAKRLTIAAQVEMGHLPEESLKQINPNGTLNVDFIESPANDDNDVIMREVDGKKVPLEWDLGRDGDLETNITERELYDAGLKYSQATSEGISSLSTSTTTARTHPTSTIWISRTASTTTTRTRSRRSWRGRSTPTARARSRTATTSSPSRATYAGTLTIRSTGCRSRSTATRRS